MNVHVYYEQRAACEQSNWDLELDVYAIFLHPSDVSFSSLCFSAVFPRVKNILYIKLNLIQQSLRSHSF